MRIPKDLKREHVLKAIADLDNGVPSLFGPSSKFDLEYEGRRYPPKAVLGGAMSHLLAPPVGNYFDGGETTNKPLRELGFVIVKKSDSQG